MDCDEPHMVLLNRQPCALTVDNCLKTVDNSPSPVDKPGEKSKIFSNKLRIKRAFSVHNTPSSVNKAWKTILYRGIICERNLTETWNFVEKPPDSVDKSPNTGSIIRHRLWITCWYMGIMNPEMGITIARVWIKLGVGVEDSCFSPQQLHIKGG